MKVFRNHHCQWLFPVHLISVATKIENGPKTKTKNLRIWKIDRRRRRRFFGILNNLWRPSKIGISLKIFKELKIFRRIERKMRNLKDTVVATRTWHSENSVFTRLLSTSGCSSAHDIQVWSNTYHILSIKAKETLKYGHRKLMKTNF